MVYDRRLVGFIKYEDDGYGVCPVLEEWWHDERGEKHEMPVWFGTWEGDPSPSQFLAMRLELMDECAKHKLLESEFEPDWYERPL